MNLVHLPLYYPSQSHSTCSKHALNPATSSNAIYFCPGPSYPSSFTHPNIPPSPALPLTNPQVTPEASPLPSPIGDSLPPPPPSSAPEEAPVKPAASPSNTRVANNNSSNAANNNNGSSDSRVDGEPVFGLSVADMRARLQAKKQVDGRKVEQKSNFKEKYDIFQKL